MTEQHLKPLMDEALEQTTPRQREHLLSRGIYGHILMVLAKSDIPGLKPELPHVRGIQRANVIRYIDSEQVEQAQRGIEEAIKIALAKGEDFRWTIDEIL